MEGGKIGKMLSVKYYADWNVIAYRIYTQEEVFTLHVQGFGKRLDAQTLDAIVTLVF